MERDDREIIKDIKSNNEGAVAELLAKHTRNIYKIVYSLNFDYHDVMDISQEVFVKLSLNIKNFREESSFTTYMYRVVLNTCYDYKKKKKIETNSAAFDFIDGNGREKHEPGIADAAPTQDYLEKEIMSEYFKKAVSNLSERQRLIFILKHWGSFKIREIAGFFKISQSAVKTQLKRAFETVKDRVIFDENEPGMRIA
jgi:RNA polymerase sigma-70 factor (ECF subfamily)